MFVVSVVNNFATVLGIRVFFVKEVDEAKEVEEAAKDNAATTEVYKYHDEDRNSHPEENNIKRELAA